MTEKLAMTTAKFVPALLAVVMMAMGTLGLTPTTIEAKETPEQVRERQAKVRERVEQSRKRERDELATNNSKAPCPLPKELESQTADGLCASKGYKDQFGRPAKGILCQVPAKKADDKAWQFLWSYEHWHGCNLPGGCTVRSCNTVYKNSAYTRPQE